MGRVWCKSKVVFVAAYHKLVVIYHLSGPLEYPLV